MQNNVGAAREIAEARTSEYSSILWAEVPVAHGPQGAYVTFPGIVSAAIVGREAAFSVVRGDLVRFQPPAFDPVAVEVLTAWFLDYRFFRTSLERAPVGLLFGPEPVAVTEEMVLRLAVAAAQFLCGYEEPDSEKRIGVVPFAALAIKESMWGGPLPEEWIS
jgi:hypothetical protein